MLLFFDLKKKQSFPDFYEFLHTFYYHTRFLLQTSKQLINIMGTVLDTKLFFDVETLSFMSNGNPFRILYLYLHLYSFKSYWISISKFYDLLINA